MTQDESIIDTLITWPMVEVDVQKDYKTKAKTGPNRKAVHLGDTNGYISKCALITFDWTEDQDRLPKEGIMKITSSERFLIITEKIGAYDNALDQAALFNDCEVNFYRTFWNLDVTPEIPVPKFISGRTFGIDGVEAGYLILERLNDFHNVHIWHDLSEPAALDGIKTIAKLAAYSIKHPENARKLAETKAFDVHFADFTTIPKAEKGFNVIIDRYPDKRQEMEKVKQILPVFENIDVFREAMVKNIKMPLIVHGDMWPGNILWKKEENGHLTVKAVVDWQILHLGNPCEDIVRFLIKALGAKEYRDKRDFYLKAYYDDLLEVLAKEKLPWRSLEDFIADYERVFPLIFTVWLPPFIGLVSEEQIKGGDGEEAHQRLSSFNEKFRGMVDEAVRCIEKRYS